MSRVADEFNPPTRHPDDDPHPSDRGLGVVSGGQTGVDRAALDAALARGLPCAGWCPRGRRAEDGPIHRRYPLKETPSSDYAERTQLNVRDSDGTLVVTRGAPTGGTALTLDFARDLARPLRVVDLAAATPTAADVREWIDGAGIITLNVAGPRASTQPGIYAPAYRFLHDLFGSSPSPTRPRS